jgi:NAD(P)-dependent dehydrogenase (short-subunit alcohol dehydrogenase family)
MIGLTRQLAHRYGSRGIRVNAVCPSQTLTEMLVSGTSEEQRNKFSRENPMRRLAEQDEVGEVVRFLISKKCEYMNGACVDVNGGVI